MTRVVFGYLVLIILHNYLFYDFILQFSPLIQCNYQLNYSCHFNQEILSTVVVVLIVIRLFSEIALDDKRHHFSNHHLALETEMILVMHERTIDSSNKGSAFSVLGGNEKP